MKLRQKLAAVLAATMVVTAVPVTTMAASTNRITKSLTVAKDNNIGITTTAGTIQVDGVTLDRVVDPAKAPELKVDLKDNMAQDDIFTIKITDGEFLNVEEYQASTQAGNAYEITRVNKNELQVKVMDPAGITATTGDEITVPLFAKATGEQVKVTINPEDSTVSAGEFVIATTNSAKGAVTVADATTFFDNGTVAEITVDEAYVGAFKAAENKKLTITLANDDFEFVSGKAVLGRGFEENTITLAPEANDKQVIVIDLTNKNLTANARGNVTIKDLKVRTTRGVKTPEIGDLNIELSGDLVEDKEYKVANVADFGTSLKMKDDKVVEVAAGQNKKIEFSLKENVDDSINSGRTVEITLDQDAYFTTDGSIKVAGEKVDSKNYITKKIDGVERVIGFETELTAKADERDEFKFEGTVVVPVDFTGDIKVLAEGRAIGEELETVAITAKAPVEIETEAAVLKVGLKEQEAGKVVITETEKAMLKKGKTLVFDLADEDGMEFTGKPEVEVTAGDLKLGEFEIKDGKLIVEVKRESKEASTIEIKNFGIKLDRTVPQGKYDLKIGGEALVDAKNATKLTVEDFFIVGTPNTEDITNGMRKGTASFVNGATTYTVNGETKEMDAATFISKAGRMMLPVRYVSEAFGIEGNNVIFADGTVTILAGTRTLQVKNGSDIAVLNGAQIKMAEKVVIKEGRTYVPVGEVGRLLGVSVSFDDATKTATFENK